MNIYKIIEELRSDNSRLYKESILKREYDNELLKQVLVMALDPSINYFIKKIPDYTTNPIIFNLEFGLKNLDALSSRKYTGNNAIEHLQNILSGLNEYDAQVVELIIARDLKCGINASTINKIWKNLIPETPYMRCSLLKDLPKNVNWKDGLISQEKLDGSFLYTNYDSNGDIEFFTRNGTHYDSGGIAFHHINNTLKIAMIFGYQLHGELLVSENGNILPREISNGILNSLLKVNEFDSKYELKLKVWDIIPIENFVPKGKCEMPYYKRYELLKSLLIKNFSNVFNNYIDHITIADTRIVYSLDDAMNHYQELLASGGEGAILKLKEAIWSDKTSKQMFKLKLEFDIELIIVGYNEGKGKNANTFGSLICQSSDGLLEVGVSGFKDDVRQHIWNNINSYMNSIITVRSNSIMKPTINNLTYSLFLPRFIEMRDDKSQADSLERILQQYDSLINKM